MSSEKRTKNDNSVGWEKAARDARRQIEEAKRRISSLQQSVRICEQKVRDAEPWPGEQLATHIPEQQHSD